MIRLGDYHEHYNFLWDLKQMKEGREEKDLDKIFNEVQKIIEMYDSKIEEMEQTYVPQSSDLAEYFNHGMEILKERLMFVYNNKMHNEVFGVFTNPEHRRIILDFEESLPILYMGEEWEEEIKEYIFLENWKYNLLNQKKKKEEKEKEIEEQRAKLQEDKEYKKYLELKEKFDK
ncbi:MAG: hypothetical protein ACRCXT_23955 [Paraclostridium sp.]